MQTIAVGGAGGWGYRIMVLIISDNRDIQHSLDKNVILAKNGGATFDDDLVIKCVGGTLSVEAPPDSAGKTLIRLPWDCLVPVELFQFAIADDNIVISSHEAALAPECVMRMEALLELYNLCDKLARHRRTSPWPLLASHPELLEPITRRLPSDLLEMFKKFVGSGNYDDLILDSFFHTRPYDYRESEKAPPFPVLMPVIDFMNHDLRGAPVQLEDQTDNGGTLTIKRSVPVPGTGNECFAFYGLYDSFDTWMSYGFLDENAPFVRSVPMTIDLPRLGTIRVANYIKIRDHADLPPSSTDLHLFIPKLLARRGNHVEVTSLLLPGPQMPDALRRALVVLINEMSPGHPQQRDLVMQVEEQIVDANRAYYEGLLAFLRSLTLKDPLQSPILDNFVCMCELQLARVESYAGYARG
jgi:hypothetical protein